MEIIKFDRVISVSNELQGHGIRNILEGEISPSKNWMCEKGTERAVAILQLERTALITSVHVGNAHSAFVEVLVGKAADSADQFESLIPMSVFMNLHESKTGTNPNRTRFFNRADFNEAAAGKAWDRVKVVCSQPFNKHVPYGLCFLKVHGEKEARRGTEGDDIQVGSFFKKKRSSGGDTPLAAGEPMRAAEEKETKLAGQAQKTEKPVERRQEEERREKKEEKTKKKVEEAEAERREKKEEKMKRKAEEAEGTPKRRKEEKQEERKTHEAENGQKRKKEEKQEGERNRKTDQGESSSKQKKETKREEQKNTEDTQKPKKDRREGSRKRKKPFDKLMEGVVLVISGFQNPLRGDIRSMALQMGAKYSPDWAPHCTHLVCAYENTPKFRQVKGKGKIVKKDWVERCHRDRRRYPWRRFALDRTDLQKPESEEEIEAGEEVDEQVPSTSRTPVGGSQTGNSGTEDYNLGTDDDEEEEEERVDTTEYPMPHLPDLFAQETFFVDPRLKGRAALERYIVAYNGILKEAFDEDVDYYVTNGAPVELFREKAPNLIPIKPSWIWEINSRQKRISTGPHLVK